MIPALIFGIVGLLIAIGTYGWRFIVAESLLIGVYCWLYL